MDCPHPNGRVDTAGGFPQSAIAAFARRRHPMTILDQSCQKKRPIAPLTRTRCGRNRGRIGQIQPPREHRGVHGSDGGGQGTPASDISPQKVERAIFHCPSTTTASPRCRRRSDRPSAAILNHTAAWVASMRRARLDRGSPRLQPCTERLPVFAEGAVTGEGDHNRYGALTPSA